jgi:hypothetical protein
MTEPTDATQVANYTFTKPEGLLAHYTKAAYVFEDILASGTLRLSPYRLMRDPIENKDILPSIAWSGDPPDADRAIQQVYTELKAARDRIRVLSFTHDADDRSEYSGFDCCWARPRMWEQYGDVHRGACLLFDRPRLERAIHDAWPRGRTYMRDVDYSREGIAASRGPIRTLIDERIFEGKSARRQLRSTSPIGTTPSSSSRATTLRPSTSTASCSRRATTTTPTSTTAMHSSASCSGSASPSGSARRQLQRARISHSSSAGCTGSTDVRTCSECGR